MCSLVQWDLTFVLGFWVRGFHFWNLVRFPKKQLISSQEAPLFGCGYVWCLWFIQSMESPLSFHGCWMLLVQSAFWLHMVTLLQRCGKPILSLGKSFQRWLFHIYLGKWNNISLTWIVRPFGDDFPKILTMIPVRENRVRSWWNLPRKYHIISSI